MASPQTEKGYTRLANELAQAVYRFPFSGQEARVFIWAIRASYGWQRKETAPTSVRVLAAEVRMPDSTAGWALAGLCKRGVLIRVEGGGFRVNKNYDEWLERGMGQLDLVSHTATGGKKNRKARRRAPLQVSPAAAIFKSPSLSDVKAYCLERKSPVDPERFHTHYEATGWLMGKKPMTNWKSAVCYWERTQHADQKHSRTPNGDKICPLCEEHPLPNANAVVCDACGPRCRACSRDTAKLKIVTRRDNTKTAVCAGGCQDNTAPIARAGEPKETRFMAEHRRRVSAREKK